MGARPSVELILRDAYEFAHIVRTSADNSSTILELPWDDPECRRSLGTFSKISLLHRYIFAMVAWHERELFRQKDDLFDDDHTMIESEEQRLRDYGVELLPFNDFLKTLSDDDPEDGGGVFLAWVESQEAAFATLWERVTDEVFHILFGNRAFLLSFNEALVEWLRDNPEIDDQRPPNIARSRRPIPRWVKDAVFYRDQGKCSLCRVDVSGLLSPDSDDHFDHMVPLAAGGVNDPTNIQLLCGRCNRGKGDGYSRTGHLYTAWWT